jgi:hypothetical protein
MKKGFELRLYDINNNVIFKEFFTSYKNTKNEIENRGKQLLNDPKSIAMTERKWPASFKVNAL